MRLTVALLGVLLLAGGSCVLYLNPQCNDQIQNGDETDVDCGGGLCGLCSFGQMCGATADCDNGICVGGTCAHFPCENGVKDMAETDVDCGGGTCRRCAGGRHCTIDDDCFGGHCDGGTCRSLRAMSFAAAVSYPSGPKTYYLVGGDLNGDGHIDLAAANEQGNSVSVFLGDGHGNFTKAGEYQTGAYPTGGAVADFNHDGHLDVITANYHGDSVSILLGSATGALAAARTFPTEPGAATNNLALGDLDGDGNLDVIAPNPETGTVSQLMGRADGTLGPAVSFFVGRRDLPQRPRPYTAVIADFNGDGRNDLVVFEETYDAVLVRLGNGDGTFGDEVSYPERGTPDYVPVAVDINLDGKLDLVVANRGSDTVSTLLGKGDGTFRPATLSPTGAGTGPYTIAVADFNQDGVPDVVTANFMSSTATVLLGVGDGTFEAPFDAGPMGIASYGVVAADFDEDGLPDIAVVNAVTNDLAIKLNTSR